jgi:hypothetical protein
MVQPILAAGEIAASEIAARCAPVEVVSLTEQRV